MLLVSFPAFVAQGAGNVSNSDVGERACWHARRHCSCKAVVASSVGSCLDAVLATRDLTGFGFSVPSLRAKWLQTGSAHLEGIRLHNCGVKDFVVHSLC